MMCLAIFRKSELEDEVVVCERAINVTVALLKKISIKYLNEPYKGNSLEIFGGKVSDQTIQNIMDIVASYFPADHDPSIKKKKRLSLDAGAYSSLPFNVREESTSNKAVFSRQFSGEYNAAAYLNLSINSKSIWHSSVS
ncbi:MAG: hypothetical protein MJY89_01940 [Bacteroidales bacterium]|nr:hypothetical protein [Bacteroidales bacterium]